MNLTTEHLKDLARSGLTAEVLTALQIEAVRPHDIKIMGVNSAYRIPYFTLEGKRNCFERWRLFPVIQRGDGSRQKYFQPTGSDSQLYLSPLCPWPDVARQPASPVVIVEGEKKAAAACTKGFHAIGVAGLWNWRQKLDTGERLTIPTIDLFRWHGREVLLVPDSDAWAKGRERDLLGGFYALGQELVARGATVRFVRLRASGAAKVGLDDWLVAVGADWEDRWSRLEQVTLEDSALKVVAAWWQGWREKQAIKQQFREERRGPLELSIVAGLYRVAFPSHRVILEFDRLTDARGGVTGELTVILGGTVLLGSTHIGLKSDSARDRISKTLDALTGRGTIPWKRLLGVACTAVLNAHRRGTPIITLEPDDHTSSHVPFILNPLVYRGHQTLAFAPGGSCKSYLAFYFALLACHGRSQTGIGAVKTPVLYLDWELDADTVTGRLKAIQTGHPDLGLVRPFYRRCEYPLHQDVHQIAAHVARLGVQLLIIDSAAMACGGDLTSPDSAIKLQRALRTIGCASLVLAHVPKSVQEGQETSAYGTVFFRELARNVWEFQRTKDTKPVRVALHQKKNNFGPALPPLGFELSFSQETVNIESYDPTDEPECEDKVPVVSRIRNLLDDGIHRDSQEIAEILGLPISTTKTILSNYKDLKWTMIGGQGRATKWTVSNPIRKVDDES
jgi:hypothetical protein